MGGKRNQGGVTVGNRLGQRLLSVRYSGACAGVCWSRAWRRHICGWSILIGRRCSARRGCLAGIRASSGGIQLFLGHVYRAAILLLGIGVGPFGFFQRLFSLVRR